MPVWFIFLVIGSISGVAVGLFGIGGGVILVPALVYLAGFSQYMAIGTTIAVLLPPIGLAAALEYYRHGNVDIRAAIILAMTMFIGAWVGAYFANQMDILYLRLIFSIFICCLGVYMVYATCKSIGFF